MKLLKKVKFSQISDSVKYFWVMEIKKGNFYNINARPGDNTWRFPMNNTIINSKENIYSIENLSNICYKSHSIY